MEYVEKALEIPGVEKKGKYMAVLTSISFSKAASSFALPIWQRITLYWLAPSTIFTHFKMVI